MERKREKGMGNGHGNGNKPPREGAGRWDGAVRCGAGAVALVGNQKRRERVTSKQAVSQLGLRTVQYGKTKTPTYKGPRHPNEKTRDA